MEAILNSATAEQLAAAVEANGIGCCLAWSAWPDMERHDGQFLTTTMTDVPFPFFNNVFWPRIPSTHVDATIEAILGQARKRGVPMFWWTGPATQPENLGEHLLAHGFVHGFEAPAMAVDLQTMPPTSHIPDDLTIEEVTDESQLGDWCRVMTPVYEFPEFARRPWFEMLNAVGFGEQRTMRHFIGYADNRAVAASTLYLGAGVAGISSVATAPDARRRGFGTAITTTPLLEARRLGYRYGVLFSSSMGKGIYEKIGFRVYGHGNCYVWSNESDA